MSSEDDNDEMAALQALDAVKERYGDLMTKAEYNRRKRAVLARFSGKLFKGGGGPKRRARFVWRDVPGMTNVKGTDFKEVRAKFKGDFKSDPDCRMGNLANFKGVKRNCKFMRRLAIVDGKERRYRMVLLNSGNYCFQLATDITADDSEDEDEEDSEEEGEKEEAEKAPPPVAIAPAAPKNGKRPAAPKKAEPKAAEGAGSSTDLPPKRSRKQVQKD